MTSISKRLVPLWLLCVIAGTLAPFDFVTGAPIAVHGHLFQYGAGQYEPIDFVINLLLFMPVGALLHHAGRERSLRLRSIVILAGLITVLTSGLIEYLQVFLPTRDSSIIDVLVNTCGALVGVAVDRRWGAPAEARLNRWRLGTSSAMLAGCVAAFLVFALLFSGVLQARTRLTNWNADYPLLIGNERTGNRPWLGRVRALAITDAATPLAAVRQFSAGRPVAITGAPIAAFDLIGNPPYRDAAGVLPDLNRTNGKDWLETAGPVTGLAARLQKTNAFTIRIECATDDTDQDGPARILSNSVSTLRRNFTLGQQGSDLVFRLRTPDTGVNGYPLEIRVPGVFVDRRAREILVTYDGAVLLIAAAGSDHVSRTELSPGSSVALAIPDLQVRSGDLQMYKLAYVAALSLVPGILIGLLGRSRYVRRVLSIAWVLGFSLLLELTEVAVSGRAFDWSSVATTAGVAAGVLTILAAALFQPDVRCASPLRSMARVPRDVTC